ncbi:MAG: aminopeptidase [Phenylobacterium sp.]|uniref:M55 family metallopeptidase n=1 Tax=Phenylobacterium sp. TaxID=1871053 RepID=UPI0025E6D7A3|nr:M55 family metallopeptidase [Phenylobacterium sp.]MBI1197808.1 aminopeptidase [Phenylobacterium sp.]
MKFYISADIEGVGGIAHFDSGTPGNFDYGEARLWMTNEVIAAAEGAHAAGCDEVVVSDSHLFGRNIMVDRLPDYVRLTRCWPRPLLMMDGVDEPDVIGAAFIGYHVGAASPRGLCPHTVAGGHFTDVKINGESVSETHISALAAGEAGVPVLLATGDDAYVEHAREVLGDIETVATKTAISHTAANTLTPSVCCDLIREATRRAVERRAEAKLYTRDWPVDFDLLLKGNRMAELLSMLPNFERVNGYTVRARPKTARELNGLLTFFYQMISLK